MFDLSVLSPDIRAQIEASAKWRGLFAKAPDKLLAIDGNAKTIKGRAKGFATAILYMAPASLSGANLCPMAMTAQCDKACLNTAGRGAMAGVQMSRLRKALYFNQFRGAFMLQLVAELRAAKAWADKRGFELLVRLNGTSDIRWENVAIPGPGGAANVMALFPEVQFYDYTKLANRKDVPANYDLTFSYSGVAAYAPNVIKAVKAGMRVAVVFRNRSSVEAKLADPSYSFLGLPLVDGDNTDIRHLDAHGTVVALYAKGAAKKDTTGFVVD